MKIIEHYEEMLSLSQQMAQAAEANEWDRLIELERGVASIRQQLEIVDPVAQPAALSPSDQSLKRTLIQEILRLDRVVRTHTEAWMDSAKIMLGHAKQERDLRAAYFSHS